MGGLGSCVETRAERKALNAHILSIHDRDGAGRVIRHEICVQKTMDYQLKLAGY